MKTVISISGKRLAGKDVTANMIAHGLGLPTDGTHRFGFANVLKDEFVKTHGIKHEQLENGHPDKEKYREGMIHLGMSRRAIEPNYWCDAVLDNVRKSDLDVFFVPDTRFANELEHFQDLSDIRNIRIRLDIHDSIRRKRGWKFDSDVDLHESEIALDFDIIPPTLWDIVVTHDGIRFHVYKNTIHANGVMVNGKDLCEILKKAHGIE